MGVLDVFKRKELREIARLEEENRQLKDENERLDRFKAILNVEAEVKRRLRDAEYEVSLLKEDATKDIESYKRELEEQANTLAEEISRLKEKSEALQKRYEEGVSIYEDLKRQTDIFRESLDLAEYGLYEPHFDFDSSERYKNEICIVREQAKVAVKGGWAVQGGESISWNGSISKGQAMVARMKKVILRAFNGEVDSFIANVEWNNVVKMEDRIKKSAEAINSLYRDMDGIGISPRYVQLRTKELHLAYEYKWKKHEEKEVQRAIREQMREEEKAQKEIEAAMIKAQKEEETYQKALAKARSEVETLEGSKQEKLLQKIKELEARVLEAGQNKERALSMAQQTKRGYVYVISNIGSFGENMYKIGMTRRLDPLDRVRELGDASVPFPFDVHALIFSENAPALETHLHKAFENKRTNKVNPRKEFFCVTLEEIEQAVRRYGAKIEFTKTAEARDWRETTALLLKDSDNETINAKEYPKRLFNDAV